MGGELDLSFIPVTTQLLNILFHSGVTNVLSYMSLSSGQVYIPPIWSSVLSAGKFRVVLPRLESFQVLAIFIKKLIVMILH